MDKISWCPTPPWCGGVQMDTGAWCGGSVAHTRRYRFAPPPTLHSPLLLSIFSKIMKTFCFNFLHHQTQHIAFFTFLCWSYLDYTAKNTPDHKTWIVRWHGETASSRALHMQLNHIVSCIGPIWNILQKNSMIRAKIDQKIAFQLWGVDMEKLREWESSPHAIEPHRCSLVLDHKTHSLLPNAILILTGSGSFGLSTARKCEHLN